MHLRLACDLFLRSFLGFSTALVVAATLQDPRLELFAQPSERVALTEFGVVDDCDGFVVTRTVPLTVGQTFGWRLAVPDGQPVAWREELILPEAPAQWSGAHFIDISDDGRVAVTAGIDLPYEGLMGHGWTVTEGDPAGRYQLRLWVDGVLHETFEFDVQ